MFDFVDPALLVFCWSVVVPRRLTSCRSRYVRSSMRALLGLAIAFAFSLLLLCVCSRRTAFSMTALTSDYLSLLLSILLINNTLRTTASAFPPSLSDQLMWLWLLGLSKWAVQSDYIVNNRTVHPHSRERGRGTGTGCASSQSHGRQRRAGTTPVPTCQHVSMSIGMPACQHIDLTPLSAGPDKSS